MTKTLAPEVRTQFAKRLKEMRVQAGFPRARYFAKSLGIEENRYTRYERAEVEPSLTLIHKICEVLRVSPNELLGFADRVVAAIPGFGEEPQAEYGARDNPPERHGEQLAWRLAAEVAAVRNAHAASTKGAAADPFAGTRETGRVFQLLLKDPFKTVSEVVADPALQAADADRKIGLARLIDAYTEAVSRGVGSGEARR
jgi:transcriptional regulator with XRE-family HTH domain